MNLRHWVRKLLVPLSSMAYARRRPRRYQRPRYAPCMECLEDRTVLSTIAIVGTMLRYAETSSIDHDLTVSYGRGQYTIADNEPFTALPVGWTGTGTNTATGPDAGVTDLIITTGAGSDSVAVQSVNAATNNVSILTGTGNDAINLNGSIVVTGSLVLQSGGTINETGAISAGLLMTSSVTGTILTGHNTVGSFNATNTSSGDIRLTNTAEPLTITGITNSGGNIIVNNTGDANSANWIGIQNTGPITTGANGSIALNALVAGRIDVGAPVSAAGTGAVSLTTTNGYGIVLSDSVRGSSGPIDINGSYRVELAGTAGIATAGSVTLTAGWAYISESGTGAISAGSLTANAVNGIRLTAANAVSSFNAWNRAMGDVVLTNRAMPLTITGIKTADSGNIIVNNTGDGSGISFVGITNTGPISTSGAGNIALNAIAAGRIDIHAPVVVRGSGSVALTTNNYGILVDNELSSVSGDISATGAWRIELNGNARITTNNTVTLSVASGGAHITEYGSATISARSLVASAGTGITLNNANTVGILTANTTAGDILFSNTAAPLTIANLTAPSSGYVNVVNAGGISTTGAVIAAQVYLTATDTITLGADLSAANRTGTAASGGLAILNASAGGVNQTEGRLTSGQLLLTGGGTFSLPSTSVGTLAANILGSLTLHDTITLTIGSVGSMSGITTGNSSTPGGNVSISGAGTMIVNQPIDTRSGTGGVKAISIGVAVNADIVVGAGNVKLTHVAAGAAQPWPTVLAINRLSPPDSQTNATNVVFEVIFSKPVIGVDASDFRLVLSGVSATIGSVTPVISGLPLGSVYRVAVNGITGSGTLGLNLVDNSSIYDFAANPLAAPNYALAIQGQQTFPVGTWPRSVVAGDVNGDLKPDLAVANGLPNYHGTSNIGVLLGNGNGTFQAQQTFGTALDPRSIALADVNGDAKLDLIAANAGSDNVGVRLGNGDGSFQAPQHWATGDEPVSLAVVDVNGDAKLDLITANNRSTIGAFNVSVLLGNGNGTFKNQQSFATGQYPRSVLVADVNGDGKPDLLADTVDGLSVLLGNGNGTFQNQQILVDVGALAVGDFNGDLKPDLVSPSGDNALSVFLGNGNGTFQNPKTFPTVTGPYSFAIGDLNGDAFPDILVGSYGSANVGVLLGNGDGTFKASQTFAAVQTRSVAVADLNGDGRPDLVAASRVEFVGTVSVLLNAVRGNFTGQSYVIVPPS